jgi:hypothetical protein
VLVSCEIPAMAKRIDVLLRRYTGKRQVIK